MKYPRPAARWLARRLAGRSVTPTTGVVRLPGLPQRVEIYRDARGVPHIEAPDEEGVFIGQGFCHAQDRLWQMEFNRRATSGRLAEIVGDDPVAWQDLSVHFKGYSVARLDQFMRTIGLRKAAEAAERVLTPDGRALLDAYVRGINLYIEAYSDALPPEFRLLRCTPEPWTPTDCLCFAKGMEFELCFSWRTKLARAGVAARLAAQPKKAAALDFAYPGDGPTILRYLGAEATAAVTEGLTTLEAAARAFGGWSSMHAGSNNWVVSGAKTASGKPLLCNDPHLRLTAPTVWHQCQLKGGDIDVVGATVPCLPGVAIGHNAHIAWGITNVTADDADYYLEKFNPKNPNQVKAGRGWEDLVTREEVIRVKGRQERRVRVRESRNGPLMSDLLADFARQEMGHALSLKWIGHEPQVGLEGQLGLNRATNYEEFREALSHWKMGVMNWVYADRDGNIAYQMTGRLPQRPNGPNRVPVPGWEKKYQWADDFVPYDEMPAAFNPEEGYVVTANNKTVNDEYPHYISDFYEPPHRSTRIHELLGPAENLTTDDMRRFQFDTVSVFARAVVQDVIRPLADELREGSREVARAVDMLCAWDGDAHAASAPAALFAAFYHAVIVRLFREPLGENLWCAYFETFNECIPPTEAILRDPDNPWWDGLDRTRVLHDALGEAMWECVNRLGEDAERWEWGAMHGVVLPHAMSAAPLMQNLFSIGPLSTGGDGLTINNGTFIYRESYTHWSGPAMRFVCNMGDLDDSWIITCSGQSGNPASMHYADQAELWAQGVYQPMVHTPEAYRLGDLLVLVPEGAPASGGNGEVARSDNGSPE